MPREDHPKTHHDALGGLFYEYAEDLKDEISERDRRLD
jgi:hypothetical protein